MKRQTTAYYWTAEQGKNGRFEYAKRKTARAVKGQLPPGWSYKIMAPYIGGGAHWSIKVDYFNPVGSGTRQWVTLRWFPCDEDWDTVSMFTVHAVIRPDRHTKEMSVNQSFQEWTSDIEKVKGVVQQIFDGLIPDPLMQLHARAKKAVKQFSPTDPEVEA